MRDKNVLDRTAYSSLRATSALRVSRLLENNDVLSVEDNFKTESVEEHKDGVSNNTSKISTEAL